MKKVLTNRKLFASRQDVKHFVAIVGLIVGSFLLLISLGVFAYVRMTTTQSGTTAVSPPSKTPVAAAETADAEEKGGFIANLLLPPEKTSVLVVGLDKGESLTDVILVGVFDRDTRKIDIISIPRDTRIALSQADISALNSMDRHPPSVMKINALNSYAGKTYGMEYLTKQLEGMLGIEIDYYATVNLKGFRNIVDAVDGVRMDIPAGGLYYSDPEQNLVISVPGGSQLLDGAMAEGVVRFRNTYRNGDLQRIEVQHEFMKQFFAQVVNKDAIMKNLGSFLTTIISHVRTDFGIQDIPLYLRYITDLKAENITFHTLPGYSDYLGEASYFFYDPQDTANMMTEIFRDAPEVIPEAPEPEAEEPETEEPETEAPEPEAAGVDLKSLKIQVLNGSGIAGLAAETRQLLAADGLNVVEIGDYKGTQKPYTRIVAREPGIAEEFEPYFNSIMEELDTVAISRQYDVVIILGTGE